MKIMHNRLTGIIRVMITLPAALFVVFACAAPKSMREESHAAIRPPVVETGKSEARASEPEVGNSLVPAWFPGKESARVLTSPASDASAWASVINMDGVLLYQYFPAGDGQEEDTSPGGGDPQLDATSNKSADSGDATGPPAQIENGQIIGHISVPSVGILDKLAVGTSVDQAQQIVETCASILCYEYMGLPEQAPVSVVCAHNFMAFNKLKDAKIGDDVILELDWGVFEYTVSDIKIQSNLASARRKSLVLVTCYPFDERNNPTSNAYFICAPKDSADEPE